MESKNVFSSGKMNRDADERLIQQGEYRYALNARVLNSATSGVGALENALSNEAVTTSTDLDFGTNPVCLGSVADDSLNKIWWFVRSDEGSYIAEYDIDNNLASFVLHDERAGNANVLNFSKSDYVQADVLYDNDNDIIMLFFTDGINEPRKINVEEAKLLSQGSFLESDITVIKKPPLFPPTLTLSTSGNTQTNNLKEKFITFAYRYEYSGGEYSVLSPFSEVAFQPFDFTFDYSISSNESMLNKHNSAAIEIETGGSDVVKIDLVFKIYGDDTLFLIESFDKSKLGIGNDTNYTVDFDNNKIYKLLDSRELKRYYDNVPLTAKTQAIVDNRIMYGNYTENFDLKDRNGDQIKIDFTTSVTSKESGTPGPAYRSVKTNRDYELGLVYLDDFGRSTTVLTSNTNSVYVDASKSKSENSLQVQINSLPPKFATKYRIFVKQTKQNYYNILPTIFRTDTDTGFVYVLLNATDVNKVKEDDFVIVKADTGGQKTTLVETKVLEVSSKDLNFLEAEDYPGTNDPPIAQPAGVYMKIKPVGFRMNLDDYDVYENNDYDTSANDRNDPLGFYGGLPAKTTGPFYYGTTSSAGNDITIAGTYSGSVYARLTIQIDGTGDGISTFDTFTWAIDYLDDGTTPGVSATGVTITPGVPITLADGITVDWAAATGHDTSDEWNSTLKPANPTYDNDSKAYSVFKGIDEVADEEIRAGTILNFEYDEYNEATQYWTYEFVSSGNYPNLEEWYFKSGAKPIFDAEFSEARVFFERGTYGSRTTSLEQSRANTAPIHLIIKSFGTQNNDFDSRVKVDNRFRITKRASTDELCFETKPVEDTTELYYETPQTYSIVNGYHTGTAASAGQIPQVTQTLTQGSTNLTAVNNVGYVNVTDPVASDDWDNFAALSSDPFSGDAYKLQFTLEPDDYTAFANYTNEQGAPGNGSFGFGQGKTITITQGSATLTVKVWYFQRNDITGGTRVTLFDDDQGLTSMSSTNYVSGSGSFANLGGDFTVVFGDAVDIAQSSTNPATIVLPYFNCYAFGNTVESIRIRDLFNAPVYKLDTKPLTNLQEYKKSFRTTSITWSGIYEQSTQFNALNDFSLADLNYKDLDDEYGNVGRIVPRGSDLIAFQENRVSRILVNKNILFNADGSGNVGASTDILGTVVPYAGEFGVTRHPFSVSLWGGRIYFVDERRGAVCRLSQDGIEQISDFGMVDFFRDNLKGVDPFRVLGGFDPHDREYVVSLQGTYSEWRPDTITCELIYDDDAPPTSTTSTTSTSSTTTSSTTAPPTTSSTTFFF